MEEELLQFKRAYHGRLSFLFFSDFQAQHPGQMRPLQAELEALCVKHQIRYLDLVSDDQAFLELGVSPHGFANTGYNQGHWNTAGHELAGRRLGQLLEEIHKSGIF